MKKEQQSKQLDYIIEGDDFKRITLAVVVSERHTKVSRGENRNRIIKNSNIAVARKIEIKKTGNVVIDIPYWIQDKDEISVIAYTQDSNLKITGATKKSLMN